LAAPGRARGLTRALGGGWLLQVVVDILGQPSKPAPDAAFSYDGPAVTPPPPPPRTKWTRRVPHLVLIGHAASLTPY